MTDKEQRYVLVAIPETGREETCPFYSVCDGVDDCGVLGLKYNTCKVCNAGMTRSEAVERMAKAICKISCNCKYYVCGNCTEYLEHYTTDIAEAALDALLGEKK